jgi:DNA-binding phage protein
MDIAHGSVKIDLNDADVVAGLRKVDAEFSRTMDKIGREQAVASINADLAPLTDKVEKAKRKLRELQGEKASARVDANTAELTRKIKNAERELKRLDGRKATLEIKLKGAEKVLAAEAALEAAEHKRAKAAEDAGRRIESSLRQEAAARQRASRENLNRVNSDARVMRSLEDQRVKEQAARMRQVENDARVSVSLERQRVSSMRTAETEAHRMDAAFQKAAYNRDVGSRREVTRILSLQKQYARLTDQLEALSRKHPVGREARAKVNLDATGVVAKMEALKAELNFLGAHPPIDIKADVNKRGLARVQQTVTGFVAGLANKASGLQDLTLRLGPFTTSLRGLGVALGFLGPSITDLLGAAGSLVGVLGAGVAGAAALGAGAVTGLAGDFLGLKFATRNTSQELAQARTSINAYQSAVLKYGAGSDKAIAKQKEMNSVLQQISPLAREAALGTERFFKGWDASTKPTQNNLGTIAKQGFEALNKLRPMWAASTNEMSGELQKALGGAFKFLGGAQGRNLLSGIFGNINAQIPTLLHGLGSLGHAFLNLASAGASNFGSLANGFDHFATSILNFTQQDSFGATVHRWVKDAGDVMRFFGALTRVLVHFFGDGSQAGDRFVNTMTKALNRWDTFLTSVSGRNKVGEFFSNSVAGAQQLYSALKPIIQLFALWSIGLEPAVAAITSIAAWLTNAAASLGKIVGLGNPLATLGTTLGAMFAVSKIGSFVSLLARAAGLIKDMAAAGGAAGVLKGVMGGGLLGGLKGGGGIVTAAEAGANAMRAAIISGATVGAAELRAAMVEGGAVGAAEGGAGGGIVGAAKKLILPSGFAAEAAGAEAAIGGISIAAGAATIGVLALGGGLIYLGLSLDHHKTAVDRVNDALKENAKSLQSDATYTRLSAGAQDNAAKSRHQAAASIKALRTEMQNATKGTVAYRDLQLKLYDANQKLKNSTDAGVESAHHNHDAAQQTIDDERKRIKLINDRLDAAKKEAGTHMGFNPNGTVSDQRAKAQADATAALTVEQRRLNTAYNARAAAALNVGRAERGMGALAGKAAQQMGALARQSGGGQKLAQTISLKYENPTNAGNVASAAKAALGSGIKVKTVMQIVADSSDADAAIKRIRSITLARKMQQVGITGHNGVLSMLSAIDRKAIRRKIARIIENGGNPTIDKINKIISMQIRDKPFSVTANVSQALAQISLMQSGLSAIQSKSIVISATVRMKGYPHASGVGPGEMGTHAALIGEGGAPEWYYNTKHGIGYKTAGPQFARIGPDDAVIPTEPKYKTRGRAIVSEIASDLGMRAYKTGKKPAKKASPKKAAGAPGAVKVPTGVAQAQRLGVPNVFKSGGVDEGTLSTELGNAVTAFRNQNSRLDTARQAEARAKKAYDRAKGEKWGADGTANGVKHKKGQRKPVPQGTIDSYDRAKRIAYVYENGGRLPGSQISLPTLAALKTEVSDIRTADTQAKRANQNIDHLTTLIGQERTNMSNASSSYAATGDSKYLDAYNTAKQNRADDITQVSSLLSTAKGVADALTSKYPASVVLQQVADGINSAIGDVQSYTVDNNTDAIEQPAAADIPAYDLNWLLGAAGLTDRYNTALKDVAVGKINNVSDDPSTTIREDLASLADDRAASGEMVGVLKDAYTAAQGTGNITAITSAADAYSSALSDQQGIEQQFSDAAAAAAAAAAPAVSQDSMLSSARADLYSAFGSNYSPVFAGAQRAADMGLGGGAFGPNASSDSAGGSTSVIINNTFPTPPADPHTWSQGVGWELQTVI